MTDIDLDRLGDIWRRQPDPAELAELKRTAERVRRRARWTQIVDIAGAVILSCAILLLVYRNPGFDTALFGGGAILLMLVSQVRQRQLRAAELRELSGTAVDMLDQAIGRVRAKLKHSRFVAVMMPVGVLLGALVATMAEKRSGGELAARVAAHPGLTTVLQIVVAAVVIFAVGYMLRSYRKTRHELVRLTTLRETYRLEEEAPPNE